MNAVLYNRKLRGIVLQGLVLALLAAFVFWIGHNTLVNLRERGIATGFGFLSSEAGFGILQHLVDYEPSSSYARVFLVGLLNTLLVSVLGVVLASIVGFTVGMGRLSRNWLVARLATVYIETFRNIPLLLQIFFWYFAVLRNLPGPRQSLGFRETLFLNIRGLYVPRPELEPSGGPVLLAVLLALVGAFALWRWSRARQWETGKRFPALTGSVMLVVCAVLVAFVATDTSLHWEVPRLAGFNFVDGLVLIPELVALLAALTLYTAAFIAEVVRAGILSVSPGQREAARALGLTRWQTTRLVVMPQALRVIVPPLTSQYLNLTKNSSLAAAIGYPDLVSLFAGTTLNQTGQALEVMGITMGVYLFLSLGISGGMNWYNRRTALIGEHR